MHRTTVAVASAVTLIAPSASAQVIEANSEFGAGTVTRDVAQNLDFLDLTLTASWSYNDIVNEFGAGGAFEGWRHATDQEFVDLVINAGFPEPLSTPTAIAQPVFADGDSPELNALAQLVGIPIDTGTTRFAAGVTSDTNLGSSTNHNTAFIALESDRLADDYVTFSVWNDAVPYTHWLVRDVPTPGALALFGIAGVATSRAGRRRR